MSSTISAARQGLHAALVAAAAPGTGTAIEGVQVTFGPPAAYEEQRVVALLGVEAPSEEPRSLGGGNQAMQRDEVYTLVVGVKAHDPAGSAESVDADAWAMADAVWDAVNADLTLGGVLLFALVEARVGDGPEPAQSGGWAEIIEVRVRCTGRIT